MDGFMAYLEVFYEGCVKVVGHKNMVSKVYTVLVSFKGGVPTTLCSFVRLSVIPSQIGQNQTGMSVPSPPY